MALASVHTSCFSFIYFEVLFRYKGRTLPHKPSQLSKMVNEYKQVGLQASFRETEAGVIGNEQKEWACSGAISYSG